MRLHSEKVLDHFQHPRNVGVLPEANGVATVENPQCGDTTRLFIRVEADRIADVRWQTRGCSTAIAASSAASEMIKGLPVSEARRLTRESIAEALGGLPAGKVHCSVLAADALRQALNDYEARRAGGSSSRAGPGP